MNVNERGKELATGQQYMELEGRWGGVGTNVVAGKCGQRERGTANAAWGGRGAGGMGMGKERAARELEERGVVVGRGAGGRNENGRQGGANQRQKGNARAARRGNARERAARRGTRAARTRGGAAARTTNARTGQPGT